MLLVSGHLEPTIGNYSGVYVPAEESLSLDSFRCCPLGIGSD